IWQSAAFAGALSLGGPVPEELGTACWALLSCIRITPVVANAVMPAAFRKSRRSIVFWVMSLLLVRLSLFLHGHHVSTSIMPHICYPPVSYTHLRAHETRHDLVCRLLLE